MKKVALYNPYLDTKGGGEKVCLALAESLRKDLGCEVYLISHKKVDLEDLGRYFELDLSGITVVQIKFKPFVNKLLSHSPLPGRIRNIISDSQIFRAVKKQGYDVFINNCYQSNLPSPIKNGIYMCMFPQRLTDKTKDLSVIKRLYLYIARRLNRLVLHPRHRSPIDTYQMVTANSAYTQSYIEKLWGRDSKILFPVCDNMEIAGTQKTKTILHVGRFFENVGESHHKRQDFLLESFSKLTKLHEDGWKLCFAGSVAHDTGTLKYLLDLMDKARGLPVEFRFNCSFDDLKLLYNTSSIYWHATGFGSDANKHPEKQEHFGITTVEAMSAGCVPIVINAAGQKESVIDGQTGFLWDSQKELLESTKMVVNMPTTELAKLRKAAQKSAERFDSAAFRKNVSQIFGPELGD